MLALVTCHIFPPSIWYGKKMNSWHLTSRLTARSFSESTASRVRSGRCPRQCATLLHGQMYLQEKTPVLQFGHTLATKLFNLSHHFLSMDGWPGDAIFFLWGQPLKIIHKNSAKKRSSPLDFIFDTCASASSSHLFLVGEAEHMWSVPFCKDKCIFSKKMPVLQFGRALTQNSWIRPIMSYLWMIGLVMRLFSCGDNLWRLSASIQLKKGPAPWILFLTRAPRPLQVTFLVGEAEHVCLYPFARTNVFSGKKCLFCNLGALAQNSWIRPIMSYLWMIGLEMPFFSCGPTFEDYPQHVFCNLGAR